MSKDEHKAAARTHGRALSTFQKKYPCPPSSLDILEGFTCKPRPGAAGTTRHAILTSGHLLCTYHSASVHNARRTFVVRPAILRALLWNMQCSAALHRAAPVISAQLADTRLQCVIQC